jgi:hypothetical protein
MGPSVGSLALPEVSEISYGVPPPSSLCLSDSELTSNECSTKNSNEPRADEETIVTFKGRKRGSEGKLKEEYQNLSRA